VSQTTSVAETPSTGSGQDSFLPLLVALIATLVLAPLAKPLPLVAFLVGAAAQLSGLFAVRHDRSFQATVIGVLAICLPLRLAAQLVGDQYPVLIVLSHIAAGSYFAILGTVVLVRVIAHPRVTSQTVIGAVCGYLLIGFVFTFGYLIVVFFDSAAIAVNGQPLGAERVTNIGEHMGELLYFSFVSLTTVGYGDIVPASPVARMLAVVEVLAGQLYLAAFVARLVGAMSAPASNSPQL
jgi:hypothetical protein